jgi:hypothetical protein
MRDKIPPTPPDTKTGTSSIASRPPSSLPAEIPPSSHTTPPDTSGADRPKKINQPSKPNRPNMPTLVTVETFKSSILYHYGHGLYLYVYLFDHVTRTVDWSENP